jgi:hypothetical protein
MSTPATYPLRIEAELDQGLSRWLWLVKWFLAIPHFVVLAFLWIAYVVLTVLAFFAILFTGRYPRSIFEFNVGVLRWTWRVSYYSFGANGTDRYPPFTLAEVPDYPTHLDVTYPDHLSRGLVLVKWWLLAIPHYIVVGLFVGGGTWFAWRAAHWDVPAGGGGLIGILVLVAVVMLLFTGRYPGGLYDFILGMNRWVLRVAAYAGLMTDEYPPFRLDMGGTEPGGTLILPRPPAGGLGAPAPVPPRPEVSPGRSGWTGGRITALVIGSLLGLVSLGLLGGGGLVLWADRTQRDAAGYLTTGVHELSTSGSALTSDRIDLGSPETGWWTPPRLLETARIRVTSIEPGRSVFVGIGPTADVTRYLAGVGHSVITDLGHGTTRAVSGATPASPPESQDFWVASNSGTGNRTLVWDSANGSWTVVVMNADGRPGIDVRADAGATIPVLLWIAVGLLAAGGVFLVGGVLLVVFAVTRASRGRTT